MRKNKVLINRLILIDFDLKNFEGHNYNYNKEIFVECNKNNINCYLITNSKFIYCNESYLKKCAILDSKSKIAPKIINLLLRDVSKYLKINLLKKNIDWINSKIFNFFNKKVILKELLKINKVLKIKNGDILYFHTIYPIIIPYILIWIGKNLKCYVKLNLLLRYSLLHNKDRCWNLLKLNQESLQQLNNLPSNIINCKIFTDSKNIQKEYIKYSHIKPKLIGFPHIPRMKSNLLIERNNEKIKLGYLGSARDGKGFELLPDIIETIIKKSKLSDIEFIIQVNTSINNNKKIQLAEKKIKSLPITILSDSLSKNEYYEILSRIDIMLIPYTSDAYKSQTSGIFSECIGAGIIPITMSKTWMSNILDELNLPLYCNIKNFPFKCLEVIKNFNFYRSKMRKLSKVWQENNRTKRYLYNIII